MSNDDVKRNTLNAQRDEKIKSLGYLCYNMIIDTSILRPKFNASVQKMQGYMARMGYLRSVGADLELHRCEKALDDEAMSLGCSYFNMFIDNQMHYAAADELCNSIVVINKKLANKADGNLRAAVTERRPSGDGNGFKVSHPDGMEPIPKNYKKCVCCGYRNRSYANYCGKCGVKL